MLRLALLAALAFLVPARAFADIVGTGAFDIGMAGGVPPSVTFDGELRFDSGARTVFGVEVNMDADVGDMTFDGDGVLVEERFEFDLSAESEGEFAFGASGIATCDKVGCLDGRATLAGRLTPDDPENLLPDDGIYTFDGTAAINVVGQAVNGMFAINAFRGTSTPVGDDVPVASGVQLFRDTVAGADRSVEVSALFESVTTAGVTEFLVFSLLPNALPAGVVMDSRVSVFVEASTTAAAAGDAFVCIGYPDDDENDVVDGTTLSAFRLLVLHAAGDDAPFTDVTALIANGLACGSVPPTLGRLALAVAPEGGSTSTTIVGASTTTSLPSGVTTTSTSLPGGETTTTSTSLPGGETTTTSTSLPGGETTTTSTVSTGESTTTSTTLPSVTTTTVLGASTTTSTVSGASTTTSTTAASRRSTTTTVASGGSTTTTLPVCTSALECLGVAIAGPICPGETVNPKLSTLIMKKLAKAQTALLAARSADSAKKIARLVKKARKQVDKVSSKASAFVSKPKGAISAACRDRIFAATALVTQQIDANRI